MCVLIIGRSGKVDGDGACELRFSTRVGCATPGIGSAAWAERNPARPRPQLRYLNTFSQKFQNLGFRPKWPQNVSKLHKFTQWRRKIVAGIHHILENDPSSPP